MSVQGTSVAAGLAQTGLQAQQVARKRDRQAREKERAAQRTREVAEVQIRGIEEDDAAEDATRLHLDQEVPQHAYKQPIEKSKKRQQGKHLDVEG
ncbi:MAG: hypothetical protein ACLFV3_08975 [Phycisphaeraceae bacterium]